MIRGSNITSGVGITILKRCVSGVKVDLNTLALLFFLHNWWLRFSVYWMLLFSRLQLCIDIRASYVG